VAILTLLDTAVLMIGRERFDSIEVVAEQAILTSFKGMEDLRPATPSLSLSHLCHLVAK
jgi:hypothetical protein